MQNLFGPSEAPEGRPTLRELNEEIWSEKRRITTKASMFLDVDGKVRLKVNDWYANQRIRLSGMYITELTFYDDKGGSKLYLGINSKYKKASKNTDIRGRIAKQGCEVLKDDKFVRQHHSFTDIDPEAFDCFTIHFINYIDPIFNRLDQHWDGDILSLESEAIAYLKTHYPNRVLNISA